MAADKLTTHAVILAGGRGTRFWPRSRTRTPKQLLNIVGEDTMLEQTIARLRPLIPPERISDRHQRRASARRPQPGARPARPHVLTEPSRPQHRRRDRLAAIHVRHSARGDAADGCSSRRPLHRRIPSAIASSYAPRSNWPAIPAAIIVLGIPPTRPETGFRLHRTHRACARRRISRLRRAPIHRKARARSRKRICRLRPLSSGTPACSSGASRRFSTTSSNCFPKRMPRSNRLAAHIGKKSYDTATRRHLPGARKYFRRLRHS